MKPMKKPKDLTFNGFQYFKMSNWEKRTVQEHVYHRLHEIMLWNEEHEGIIYDIEYYYSIALHNASLKEDYELCQALKDSAELFEIELDV